VPLRREKIDGVAGLRSVFRSSGELGATGDVLKTQALLQPLFAKPKLTDKLLAKPPFRFLLDIVVATVGATGFGVGLFAPEEQDGELVKEKEQKMAFLDKLINFLGVFLNSHCAAKSKSIVAGLEPDLTNEMLQMLGIAATLPGSAQASIDVVRRVLAGELQPDASGTRVGPKVSPAPALGSAATPSAAAPSTSSAVAAASAEALAAVNAESSAKIASEDSEREHRERSSKRSAEFSSTSATAVQQPPPPPQQQQHQQQVERQRPSGGLSSASGSSLSGSSVTSAGFTRPQTARRRPPKIKEPGVDGSGPHASSGFLAEGDQGDSDEDEDAGVGADAGADGDGMLGGGLDDALRLSAGAGGKHTREILAEQQQALEKSRAEGGGRDTEALEEGGGGGGGGGGVRLGPMRASGAAGQRKAGARGSSIGGFGYSDSELAQLQDAIQLLAKSATPLGNSLDFVPEDADDMRAELRAWRGEYQKRKDAQDKELRDTDEALAPLRRLLAEAEERVREQARKIAAVKDTISKNDARIGELLRLVVAK
jgi:TRAF3-interacting protein 1